MRINITVYSCDQCGAVLDSGTPSGTRKAHLSLSFTTATPSGLAVPGENGGKWAVASPQLTGYRQFCNPACLSRYISKLIYGDENAFAGTKPQKNRQTRKRAKA
jgi:hypothetical protein